MGRGQPFFREKKKKQKQKNIETKQWPSFTQVSLIGGSGAQRGENTFFLSLFLSFLWETTMQRTEVLKKNRHILQKNSAISDKKTDASWSKPPDQKKAVVMTTLPPVSVCV